MPTWTDVLIFFAEGLEFVLGLIGCLLLAALALGGLASLTYLTFFN